MAQGMHYATGGPQAVMLHTNVGLANGAAGAINAAMDRTPLILMSGRTPTTEQGRFGSRTVPIGWGQEMRDQTALVREACKWDYELRFPEQIVEMLDRAAAIACSTPQGPVYLSLPREILCGEVPGLDLAAPPRMAPARIAPDPAAIARAADLLAEAKRPLIIAQRGCGTSAGFDMLAVLARDWALPVCCWWNTALALAEDHPMHVGDDPGPWLAQADVILSLDSLAPWGPDMHPTGPGAQVIQMGPDPLFARQPVRNFAAHVTVACDVADGLAALGAAMDLRAPAPCVAQRSARIAKASAATRAAMRAAAEAGGTGARMTGPCRTGAWARDPRAPRDGVVRAWRAAGAAGAALAWLMASRAAFRRAGLVLPRRDGHEDRGPRAAGCRDDGRRQLPVRQPCGVPPDR